MRVGRYAFYVDEHLLRVRGRKGGVANGTAGIVVGYSADARLLLHWRESPEKLTAPPPPGPFVGGGNGDKRITAGRESSAVDPVCARFASLCLVKSSFIIIIHNCLITGTPTLKHSLTAFAGRPASTRVFL